MKKHPLFNALLLFFALSTLVSCTTGRLGTSKTEYGIFQVQDSGQSAFVEDGTIRTRTLRDFRNMVEDHPDINRINIQEMPGSMDDEANLQLGQEIHQRQMSIHILDDGYVASGGTDLFLAGAKRTVGSNVRIGVHSWGGDSVQATDFPEDSPEHQPYIDYYQSIGFSETWARDFYFFTIRAEDADNIHWMTEAELEQYEIFTE